MDQIDNKTKGVSDLSKDGDDKEVNEMEEQIDLVDQMDVPGYDEYTETLKMLNMKSDIVNGNIKISNSDLIKYKNNWFNICMGIDIFDTGFENKVNIKLEELGIRPFKRDKYLEKIELILDDKEMTLNFKNAIYERLMENCKEPEDFINNKKKCETPGTGLFDRFLGLFRKCHEKEMKDNNGILYLYDKYKTILNQNKTTINNIDIILIILNCEIRQRILSYHISLELLRRKNVINKSINSILENIYEIDKPVIKQVEEELRNKLAQDTIERRELIQQINKEEIEMRKKDLVEKKDPDLINAILEKKKEQHVKGLFGAEINNNANKDKNKNEIGKYDKDTDNFISEHRQILKNEPLIGGNAESLDLESDILEDKSKEVSVKDDDNKYAIHTNEVETKFCSSIKNILTKEQLQKRDLLNKCKTFR